MRTVLAALCLAATCLVATPLSAAPKAPAEASFRLGGMTFRLPLPSGYCLPQGLDVDVAQQVAAGDIENLTHLTLFPCTSGKGGPGIGDQNYIVIKTPRQVLLTQVSREELLKGLGEEFEKPAFAEALTSGNSLKDIAKGASEALGTPVDLSGEVAPRGKDEICAYLGGTLKVETKAISYTVAVGGCITSIEGRVMTVYWYGPDQGPAGIARLLVKTKALAATITGRPPP